MNQDSSAASTPLLEAKDLCVHFQVPDNNSGFLPRSQTLKAVDGISFSINPGETLGIVGESGCGKSTLGRAIVQLYKPTSGQILWKGQELSNKAEDIKAYRKKVSMIFQDPLASLDPRMTIGNIVSEPLEVHEPGLSKQDRKERVRAMLDVVGINARMIGRYPHEFSGGQCQRIGIARAMITRPELVVCDEPVSALDVSIQAQVVSLLENLQKEFKVSLVFISHDLSIVRHISHRILVLYLGKTMLTGGVDSVYDESNHPYAKALISSAPEPDPELEKARKHIILGSELPSPINPPKGCVFSTRCPVADDKCQAPPSLEATHNANEFSACWHWKNMKL